MLAELSRRTTISRAPPIAAAATAPWRRNGRANAATISAIAAARRSSSAQWRNPAAADRLIGNPSHEHQRRELDDLLLLALNQVDEYRNRDRAEAEKEERGKECHQPTRKPNWRRGALSGRPWAG